MAKDEKLLALETHASDYDTHLVGAMEETNAPNQTLEGGGRKCFEHCCPGNPM